MMARRKTRKPDTGKRPVTPATADVQPPPPTRRDFLWKLWLGLGGVALLEAVWLAADFFRPQKVGALNGVSTIVVAGPLEQFQPNSVTAFPQGKFYLARLEDGGSVVAVSNSITTTEYFLADAPPVGGGWRTGTSSFPESVILCLILGCP